MSPRVSAEWLALREPADAAARDHELVRRLRAALPPSEPLVIHDLGSGTGSMGRWLGPLLPGPQHWVAHDHDADLLEIALGNPPGPAADGAAVTVEARPTDLAQLDAHELSGASLITASALLDVLTENDAAGLIGVCVAAGCPVLLALSVIGEVMITPPDPLDRRVAAAFDSHQRRTTARGRLLGPDAVAFAAEQFARASAEVIARPSPWRLGPSQGELAAEWFTGWIAAACEQQPELVADCELYRRRRFAQARAGELAITIGHADVLALL